MAAVFSVHKTDVKSELHFELFKSRTRGPVLEDNIRNGVKRKFTCEYGKETSGSIKCGEFLG
jgi:hypothetical protein